MIRLNAEKTAMERGLADPAGARGNTILQELIINIQMYKMITKVIENL